MTLLEVAQKKVRAEDWEKIPVLLKALHEDGEVSKKEQDYLTNLAERISGGSDDLTNPPKDINDYANAIQIVFKRLGVL